MPVREQDLRRICSLLLKYDSDVVEIVQFGSSVYASELARDIDLLVFTKQKKNYDVYLNATAEFHDEQDVAFNVDVVPFEIGDPINEGFMRNVLGSFSIIYGEGVNLIGHLKTLGDPTYDEARATLKAGKRMIDIAITEADALTKDRLVREAFDGLFHAARIASMVYLSTEVARWGIIKRSLPANLGERFQKYINTLHLDYFYNGKYPTETVSEEFQKWLEDIEEYIAQLEAMSKPRPD